ncbi:MAG: ABC transporter substrate-binding protein [Deltaproteobacteria bacterium]|nr:ABC transporter substrate-binding protein [Deltaproteobacteria bacterium]
MEKITSYLLPVAFVFSVFIQPVSAQLAKGGEGKYLILGTTSKTVGYMGPWVAKRKGFFAAEGLNVDIPILKSSTTGIQALIGGSTHFDATSIDTMIGAYEKGAQDMEAVGGVINGATYTLVAAKKFRSFKDLKGATIGVSSLTSGATSLLRLMLEKNGLNYPRDFVLLSVGGTPERFTALQSGRVDAVILAAPLSFKALDLGFSKIGDVFDFVTHYQHSALIVKKSWARDNVDTVHRVLRALARSFQWLHHNREEAASLISSELSLERRYAEAGWEEYTRSKAWPLKAEIDMEGVITQIQIWAQREKNLRTLPTPDRYVNEKYLKAVHKELGL